uniref:VSG expression site-associated protein 221A n=3 Tax=Trypanosoma brucei TaxID=5691 RepID=ESG2_TRYBB|nr:RecName: Full=VSG expression site-associated protein 221A; AltName: Full=ESAG protein; Flags: Precursor [Trypanosoma brucei brucei]AAA30191.1 expression site associated protein (ESAG) [Trypanosoma brucei]CAD21890.1 ESAG1 [Trypanosoma brucei]CAQ57292.1 expression site-associated gene 1 (ESAG1) protein [Trypanosoma brucei brucei]
MKVEIVELVVLLFSVTCVDAWLQGADCTRVADHKEHAPVTEAVCYLRCLSDALNKLYSEGEKKLLVTEEVYANASLILDDMEGRAGESSTYLSVIRGVMEEQTDRLEKLISYGNKMGNLVAKAGGLFAALEDSLKEVRKEIPGALIKTNKYYTSVAEIVRTVWEDVGEILWKETEAKCGSQKVEGVGEIQTECGAHTCPFADNGVAASAVDKYKGHCLYVGRNSYLRHCFNLPRGRLYRHGPVNTLGDALEWEENWSDYMNFELTVKVQKIFGPLIASFDVGIAPSTLAEMINNITSLQSRFNEVHSNFTSILFTTKLKTEVYNTDSTI